MRPGWWRERLEREVGSVPQLLSTSSIYGTEVPALDDRMNLSGPQIYAISKGVEGGVVHQDADCGLR